MEEERVATIERGLCPTRVDEAEPTRSVVFDVVVLRGLPLRRRQRCEQSTEHRSYERSRLVIVTVDFKRTAARVQSNAVLTVLGFPIDDGHDCVFRPSSVTAFSALARVISVARVATSAAWAVVDRRIAWRLWIESISQAVVPLFVIIRFRVPTTLV